MNEHRLRRDLADLRLAILESRTGHCLEFQSVETRDPWGQVRVYDHDVNAALAEGMDEADAVDNAVSEASP